MGNVVPSSDPNAFTASREADAERGRRIAHEDKLIAAALASVAAGRTVSEEQFNAWVDSLGTDHELPVPKSGR